MQIDNIMLANNLNTLFIHNEGATSATVQIWFRAGSALEETSEEGIAHFLEHMFFKGTPTRPGPMLTHAIESYGAEVNAFTSFDYTCYYINTPNHSLNKSIDILLDMVSNPLFDENELIPERDVVFEEYRRAVDNPSQFHFSEIQKGSFTGKYGHQILGNEKTIKNFTREQVISFRKRYYNNNNALFIVAGDLNNRNELEKIIEKYSLPHGEHSSFGPFKLKTKSHHHFHHKDVKQASLSFVIESPSYLEAHAASEDLALNVMAHGEIAPFYKALVTDSSLASNISGSTMYFHEKGAHFIKIVFPPENLKKVLDKFNSTLKELLKGEINAEDVLRIKNQYVASKIYEKESIEAFAFSMGHGFAQTGDIHCEDQFVQKIKDVKISEIIPAISRIFKNPLHATLQVPLGFKNKDTLKILNDFETKLKTISNIDNKKTTSVKLESIKEDKAVKLYQLKNGIKLIYRQSLMTPTFTLHAYLKGGLAHETQTTNGQYQLLSKLLTSGHKTFNHEELKQDLELKSAYLNGFSGKNAYGVTLHGQSEHFIDLLEHFFNTLLQPEIPQKFLSLEKKLILRSLENYKVDPVKQCFSTFNGLVFKGHPYTMDMIGTKATVGKMTRTGLLKLHNERLKNSNMVFTYCGDMEFTEVKNAIEAFSTTLKPRVEKKRKTSAIKPLFEQKIHKHFDREQCHIVIGKAAFKTNDKEDLYLKMLTAHLSGQSSELFVEVRDRQGLCYAVQALHHAALEGGYFGVYIGAGHDKKEAAIKAIMDILNKLAKNGLSNEEFDRIKIMIDGQNLLNVQTIEDYANFYSIPVLHNLGLDYQHKTLAQINKIKVNEFNNFLKKFLTPNWNIVTVGP